MSFFELSSFMASKGLPFSGNFVLDGTFKRYCKDNTKKKDEFYVGAFINETHFWCSFESHSTWRKGDPVHQYRSWKEDDEISKEDLEKYRNQIKIAEEKKKAFVLEKLEEVNAQYYGFKETTDHPYLIKKGIKTPVKFEGQKLYIPLVNSKGETQTYQTIAPDGQKLFCYGLPMAGSRFVFGTPVKDKETLICEGFATGYSLHMATGKPVICAMAAGNILPVAKQMKEAGFLITHAQDLGQAGDREAKALESINVVSVKPRFIKEGTGKDFNDLFLVEGKDAVFNCFSHPLCYMDVEDLMAMDLPPLEWYVEGLIMKGSLNVIWAPPGLGKSTLCYTIAQHATMGKDFLMRKIPKRLRVLYLDGEMTRTEIREKIDLVTKAMKLTKEDIPDKGSLKIINFEMWEDLYGSSMDLYSQETRNLLMLHINQFQPDLIFFDNLSSLTGVSDEPGHSNKEESWKAINLWMRTFVRRNMGAVIVHHANKSGSIYGTGAILRSVVNVVELREHDNNPEEEMMFELHFNKARHTFGESKKPKLIYFDHQENNYLQYPFKDSNLMSAEEYKKYFYKKTSHWFSLPIPPKETKPKEKK